MKIEKIEKCIWVSQQTQEAQSGKVSLRNGSRIPIRFAYRCLYCGEYFSQVGAEEHFGKTREEYNKTRNRSLDEIWVEISRKEE